MIQANELRRGNWVKYGGDLMTVFSIDNNSINGSFYGDTSAIYLEGLEPIPLTSEILEKAGFSSCESIEVFFELSGFKMADGKILATHFKRDRGVQILHLHQLQNVYWILTGTELEINL